MKKISIVSPCYNEEENIPELYRRITEVMAAHAEYDYEIILADNASTDRSRELIREMCAADKRLKAIFNSGNFGQIRSPYNALLAASGDAVVMMCADLQEPPEVIHDFIENFTGFGLYDRCVVDALGKFHEPYPYMRGLVAEIGFRRVEIPYEQQARKRGKTKNNFFSLYDYAMTGFVNHTKLPLRLATFTGFALAALSLVAAGVYLVYKLAFWNSFAVGLAPLVIGLFFFSSVQLIFIGVIGEYIGAIWTQVKNKPLVIEEERINFQESEK